MHQAEEKPKIKATINKNPFNFGFWLVCSDWKKIVSYAHFIYKYFILTHDVKAVSVLVKHLLASMKDVGSIPACSVLDFDKILFWQFTIASKVELWSRYHQILPYTKLRFQTILCIGQFEVLYITKHFSSCDDLEQWNKTVEYINYFWSRNGYEKTLHGLWFNFTDCKLGRCPKNANFAAGLNESSTQPSGKRSTKRWPNTTSQRKRKKNYAQQARQAGLLHSKGNGYA